MKQAMKKVEIVWVDSGSPDEVWQLKSEELPEMTTCVSVGYLIQKTKDAVYICMSYHDYQYGRVFVIPRKAVMSLTYL